MSSTPDALIVGTGEYVTGYVGGSMAQSDKKCGVVGLVHFDLRRRGFIGSKIVLAGRNGTKFPNIRKHLQAMIESKYKDLTCEFESFPCDTTQRDPEAWVKAMDSMKRGDIVSVFTPDDKHFEVAAAALKRGLHCMVAKPLVKSLKEHWELVNLAAENNVLLMIEVHKRFDPIYADARHRIHYEIGEFNFFNSYMSQPAFQLETFRDWAGISSDISYYLNSHHVDFHTWSMQGLFRPIKVVGMASSGHAEKVLNRPCEDTITLMVTWESLSETHGKKSIGTATYTASWTVPKCDVHSQQRFYCQGSEELIQIDQCRRSYFTSRNDTGVVNRNPLYMCYTPNAEGYFAGQHGYGYISFQRFVEAASAINRGEKNAQYFNDILPTAASTLEVTAILEAGRFSIDNGSSSVKIVYENSQPLKLQLC